VSDDPVIVKLSRHDAVGELDAAIDLRHTCGYVTMLRATARRRVTDSGGPSPTTSAGDPVISTATHVMLLLLLPFTAIIQFNLL